MSQQGHHHGYRNAIHRFAHQHPRAAHALAMRAPGNNQRNPPMYAHEIPGLPGYEEMVERYSVNNEKWEVIKTSLYDSIAYPAAGLNTATFFGTPLGQGTGFGGVAGKTLSDTNMVAPSMVPTNISFLIQSIEIEIQPTTPSVTAQLPAVFGAQAAALLANDVFIIGRSGNVRLQILAKDYLNEAPLGRFPPRTFYQVEGALADVSTAGANLQSRLAFANWRGVTYHVSPADLRLESTVNFSLVCAWPEGLQVINNPARLFVHLNGLEYRRSQ
jgi:hypothetical protein